MLIFAVLMILAGCCSQARITIPDPPKFKQFGVFQMDNGICMDDEDLAILQENIGALKNYSDELRRILADLQKERGR